MKRPLEHAQVPAAKKRSTLDIDTKSAFRNDLFEPNTQKSFRSYYEQSGPYPHAVVPSLIQEDLLRAVRNEITTHIHFTLKETDIYRIHQSGDLANLSNLDAEALKHLPSLVRLRDALYSSEFRHWVSHVTGAGKVSGSKTDMAVNVYTPGSYLLCHDDVIGSRRVSYILYLTDPDHPWQPEWGGGLRLFPTEPKRNKAGEDIKVPLAEHSLNIPPSFGQLSFFAVRPGESYHDVEEVYHPSEPEVDGGRIRMAISGWFHIPQEGEDGFEEGIEQAQAQRSSLAQLKGAANEFDEPQLTFRHFDEPRNVMDSKAAKLEVDPGDDLDTEDDLLTEQDLTFLLHYISPSFLTPDMISDFQSFFEESSSLELEQFFNAKFAAELKDYISSVEQDSSQSDDTAVEQVSAHPSKWAVARPPHKHRYAYLQGSEALHQDKTPISRILTDLLHSHAFKKWLALVTGIRAKSLVRQNAIARRFRRGKDYALANPYQGDQPQLEFTISMTPSEGWEAKNEDEDEDEDEGGDINHQEDHVTTAAIGAHERLASNGGSKGHINGDVEDKSTGKGKGKALETPKVKVDQPSHIEFGGEEAYMAGDDDDDNEDDNDDQDNDRENTSSSKPLPSVGKRSDPAVYRSSNGGQGGDDDDGGILFANSPAWNKFSVVLRDKGTLRFVKYVSRAAAGDRWDVKGEVELAEDAFDGDGEEDEDGPEDDDEEDGEDDGDEDDEAE
ncbi:hypothetical protein PV10_01523 [Exophiala mesophila]|uniref:uS12 prolyl 3,4-dihydroxylase n=1 Tax=Exophiala mesophila TaxID=212818 RepID=A0A0D1ZTA3_EXOME|nr:uncharacterized protein PV10_01523 [Exophiala mesophila]KIV97817.1 hypothetical protein PV10_01523 [Exophiala mesophila]